MSLQPQPNQDTTLLELFRIEAQTHTEALEKGLIGIEDAPSPARIEPLMRAAHSMKGAARIVGLPRAVRLAHAMEDMLGAAQQGKRRLSQADADLLLKGVDILREVAAQPPAAVPAALSAASGAIDAVCHDLAAAITQTEPLPEPIPEPEEHLRTQQPPHSPTPAHTEDASVRVLAASINKIMGLAGECWVRAADLVALSQELSRLKSLAEQATDSMRSLRQTEITKKPDAASRAALDAANEAVELAGNATVEFQDALSLIARRIETTASRLYDEALATRMRPFADGLTGLKRLARDLPRRLGKNVALIVDGERTRVDRDILEKLEAPLTHLLQNAIDHGIETPGERAKTGKPAQGRITITARHSAGFLVISLSDDGRGLDPELLRAKIVKGGHVAPEMAASLCMDELLDFLFLPGFSTSNALTDVSGRGFGLDVVKSMAHEVGGSVRVRTTPGRGMEFSLKLPLTLSILPVLLLEIAGEPYALPMARVSRIIQAPATELLTIEGHPAIRVDDKLISLACARQTLGIQQRTEHSATLPVAVLDTGAAQCGLIVDKFLGQRHIVIQPIDPRLGRLRSISAGAFLEDGAPLLVLDADDVIIEIEKLTGANRLEQPAPAQRPADKAQAKHVLVVDDSITVREVERRLLENHGYKVAVAVDGFDAINAMRAADFDLVVTDVDMPRMNGIDLVRRIKAAPDLKNIPVMIVSYKDREEDRLLGLEAGADFYLTKSSFQDESLIKAVRSLLGDS